MGSSVEHQYIQRYAEDEVPFFSSALIAGKEGFSEQITIIVNKGTFAPFDGTARLKRDLSMAKSTETHRRSKI